MEDNTLKLTTAIYYIQSAILSINPFSVSGILILRENSMEREKHMEYAFQEGYMEEEGPYCAN